MKNSAEFSSCTEFLKTQPCKSSNQLPHIKCEDLVKNKLSGNGKNCGLITSTMEGVPLQRKSSKSNRSNSSGSKRPRMSQSEDYTSLNGTEESKDSFDKLGSNNLKCTSPTRTVGLPQSSVGMLPAPSSAAVPKTKFQMKIQRFISRNKKEKIT